MVAVLEKGGAWITTVHLLLETKKDSCCYNKNKESRTYRCRGLFSMPGNNSVISSKGIVFKAK